MSDQPTEETKVRKTRRLPKLVVDCRNKVLICASSTEDWNRFVAVPVDRFFGDLEQLKPHHKGNVVAAFCKGRWHGEPGTIHDKFYRVVQKWFDDYAKDTETTYDAYRHPYMFVHGTQEDDYDDD